MGYYFIRVNGETCHNNSEKSECYIAGEPKEPFFSYQEYCIKNNIVRIGWPATGDLLSKNYNHGLEECYTLEDLDQHIKEYLLSFKNIKVNDIIIMPHKEKKNTVYIGQVNKTYHYFYQLPKHPYECSHRLGVHWDLSSNNTPACYDISKLGIVNQGGYWIKAFSRIASDKIIKKIDDNRRIKT